VRHSENKAHWDREKKKEKKKKKKKKENLFSCRSLLAAVIPLFNYCLGRGWCCGIVCSRSRAWGVSKKKRKEKKNISLVL
jgi:hypothetical protein